MERNTELSDFDELFARISRLAVRPVLGMPPGKHNQSAAEGARLTPPKRIGKKTIKFMIFSSETKSLETGENLYSPSITVFRGRSKKKDNIKRIDLGVMPTSEPEIKKHEALLRELDEASALFNEYEQTESG